MERGQTGGGRPQNHDDGQNHGGPGESEETAEAAGSGFFSDDYYQARDRFCAATERVGGQHSRHWIDDEHDLSIDVARIGGADDERMIVLSSGLHGVEALFGSAVQLAWLDRIERGQVPEGIGCLLLHIVNPYGCVNGRRFNEDNVDLNRNFLDSLADYGRSTTGYDKFAGLLCPPSVPTRWEPFRLKAAWNILRHGLQEMKSAVASGQYGHPRGLFFGGDRPSASTRVVQQHWREWVGSANQVAHLDYHTGLGRHADFRLLLDAETGSESKGWFARTVGDRYVEVNSVGATAYSARGTFSGWASRHMADRTYHVANAEFGTFGVVRVLAALRAENRVHHYADDREKYGDELAELRECFCPASEAWRDRVVTDGVEIAARCADALLPQSRSGDL